MYSFESVQKILPSPLLYQTFRIIWEPIRLCNSYMLEAAASARLKSGFTAYMVIGLANLLTVNQNAINRLGETG